MRQENINNAESSDSINIGRYLRFILLQSKLILFIVILGFITGLTLYLTTPKTYKVSSLLQIYTPSQGMDARQKISFDFFNASETNLDNLITLYNSRSNILNLISSLNLNLKIEGLEETENLNFDVFTYKSEEDQKEKIYYLEIFGNSYNLLDDQKNLILKGTNGKLSSNDALEIEINYSNLNSEKLFKFTYYHPSKLFRLYKNKIKVINSATKSNFWTQEGLIEAFLITNNTEEGKKILNSANQIFIKDSIKVETEKAKKSIMFIDDQLKTLEDVLDARKSDLKSFKQENKSLNVNLEVQSIIELIADIEQEINKVELELTQAEVNFTRDNPLYINLKLQRDALELQKDSIEDKIKNLPVAQQEYIDLFRNLEVSEALYSELINRKLNFSLIEASTIGNIRVVDNAFVDNLVSPNLSVVFLFTFFSIFIGIIVALFRGVFIISISNPAELNDAKMSHEIIGVIPKVENTLNPFEDKKFEQSVETSILNIETIIKAGQAEIEDTSCKKIVFTSPTAANGKSFISKSISEGLAGIGHKVLLIDADLKRGDQHKLFNKETIELEFFKNISIENIDELMIKDNLYLLPRLKKIKNTFEHLYGNQFIDKVDEFTKLFDYIIIDTAPALSVSDTGLLMSTCDNNFLIVRHNVNRINEIKQTLQIIDQIGRSFDGIIYNDYQKPSGYYGYYDLYGDYSYRYYAERYLYDDYYTETDD